MPIPNHIEINLHNLLHANKDKANKERVKEKNIKSMRCVTNIVYDKHRHSHKN